MAGIKVEKSEVLGQEISDWEFWASHKLWLIRVSVFVLFLNIQEFHIVAKKATGKF